MIAILSDIHGNLEALEAVLADAAAFNVDAVYCLGDLIGYGPDPIPCIEYAMSWDIVVRGNFDNAAISDDDLSGWTAFHARKTVLRFRSQLNQHSRRHSITDFLSSLPTHLNTTDALYVHGSPRNYLNEYLFPEDTYNPRKMGSLEPLFRSLCFCGRTHIPGIFHRDALAWGFTSPAKCDHQYPLSDDKVICNVGSVGQPRDGDPRASYVLFTPDNITFRRVDYDVDLTSRKIRNDEDDDFPGQRVRDGR